MLRTLAARLEALERRRHQAEGAPKWVMVEVYKLPQEEKAAAIAQAEADNPGCKLIIVDGTLCDIPAISQAIL